MQTLRMIGDRAGETYSSWAFNTAIVRPTRPMVTTTGKR
jgi:hypothetical protein